MKLGCSGLFLRKRGTKGISTRRLFFLLCLSSTIFLLFFYDVLLQESDARIVKERKIVKLRRVTNLIIQNNQVPYRNRSLIYSKYSPRMKLLLYTAIAMNSSEQTIWDDIAIQGWTKPPSFVGFRFDCCVLFNSGTLQLYNVVNWTRWGPQDDVEFGGVQFRCAINGSLDEDIPLKVLVRATEGVYRPPCTDNYDEYVDVEFAYKRRGIAAFIKTLYTNVSHYDLISWFDIHRKLGVATVFGYVARDLNAKARRVVAHYQHIGIFEPIDFPIPRPISDMYHNGSTCFHLQGVAELDSQARANGFDYLAGFDHDEYLVPTNKEESIGVVFDRMFQEHSDAAGFTFKTYEFVTDWGAQTQSPFSVEKFLNRTVGGYRKRKHVLKPERVVMGRVRAHKFTPKNNYNLYNASEADIAIYHYHSCGHNLFPKRKKGYCYMIKRIYDTTISDLFQAAKSGYGSDYQL